MNEQEKRILVITCFGHFLSHFNMLVFPAIVLPLSRVTGLELSAVLGLSFYQYLLFGLTALPWGLAADRWGAKQLMQLFFLGAGLCGLAAAWLIDSPGGLTLALAGIGFFSGIYHPAGLGLISKGIRRISMGMGLNGMFGNVGLAAAPLLTGLAVNFWSVGGAYVLLAVLNLTGFVLMYFLPLDETADTIHTEVKDSGTSMKPFVILLVAMMLGGLTYRGATVILPTFFEIRSGGIHQTLSSFSGMDISANLLAASLTSVIYVIGIIGQFTGGKTGEHFEVRWSYFTFHLLTLPAIVLMSLTDNLPMVLAAVVYFFFLLGMQPLENTLVARLTPARFHHSAFGAKFVLTFGVGSLAVKVVSGIEAAWGIGWVFPALGLLTVLLLTTILILIGNTPPVKSGNGLPQSGESRADFGAGALPPRHPAGG